MHYEHLAQCLAHRKGLVNSDPSGYSACDTGDLLSVSQQAKGHAGALEF